MPEIATQTDNMWEVIDKMNEEFLELQKENKKLKETIVEYEKYKDACEYNMKEQKEELDDLWYLYKWYWFGTDRMLARGESPTRILGLQMKYKKPEWEDELYAEDPSSDDD